MAKIRIVHIALAIDNDVSYAEYLDDKGRVWFQTGHYEEPAKLGAERKWITEWNQLDLPEEPQP